MEAESLPAAVAKATCSGQCTTAEAINPELQAVAVELFRRYFSPDMYFIFPLMIGRQAAFGLDFRTTTTTLFFKPCASSEESAEPASTEPELAKAAPKGACSWRFRWPAELPGAESVTGVPAAAAVLIQAAPAPLLEVLFIAVWEEERDQVHGGTLVAELETQARAAGVKMMYVEIGLEQPKARRFWRKQGFGKVVRRELAEEEKQRILEAEENEEVPVPLVPLTDAQLAFFESQCLRFSDTAQYVRLLD